MRGSAEGRKNAPRSIASTYYSTTSSSSMKPSRETDENSLQSSVERMQSNECTLDYIMNRPNFFTNVNWSQISHQAGDAPRERFPQPHEETLIENIGLRLKRSFDTTYTLPSQEQANVQNIYDTKHSSPSTYDSHSTQNVASNKHYENPIKFDHWINDQAITDITNRLPIYHTTQLIRQTTNDAEKKIIWIYSYKNQHLIANDGNIDNSATPEYTSPSEKDSESGGFITHQASEPCDSPRYPKLDSHSSHYIPAKKISSRLLEPVQEVVESDTYTNEPFETAVNPHISKETLFSVNQWIDGSVHDAMSLHLPGEAVDLLRKSEKTDVREKEMQVDRNTTYPVLSLQSEQSEIYKTEWTTEHSCAATVNQMPPGIPKELEWRLSDCDETYCKRKADDILSRYDSRSRSALRNVMPPSWVYSPTPSSCATRVIDSVTHSDKSKKRRSWRTLSRCFCKCFSCK